MLNYLDDSLRGQTQKLTAGSVSGIWQMTDRLSVFLGAYEGFSPAGPPQAQTMRRALILKLAFAIHPTASSSLTGFRSDYKNLIGRCRVSDPNCTPGSEFNGGEVEIAGLGGVFASYLTAH